MGEISSTKGGGASKRPPRARLGEKKYSIGEILILQPSEKMLRENDNKGTWERGGSGTKRAGGKAPTKRFEVYHKRNLSPGVQRFTLGRRRLTNEKSVRNSKSLEVPRTISETAEEEERQRRNGDKGGILL